MTLLIIFLAISALSTLVIVAAMAIAARRPIPADDQESIVVSSADGREARTKRSKGKRAAVPVFSH